MLSPKYTLFPDTAAPSRTPLVANCSPPPVTVVRSNVHFVAPDFASSATNFASGVPAYSTPPTTAGWLPTREYGTALNV